MGICACFLISAGDFGSLGYLAALHGTPSHVTGAANTQGSQ